MVLSLLLISILLILNLHCSFPGARGLLREVWTGINPPWVLDNFLNMPRSEKTAPQERTYRTVREFGETTNFIHRWSGFFVPPVSSLYTLSVLSDDQSRLYLSPSMDAAQKQLVAHADYATGNSWTRLPTQTSVPIRMERGQYYYLEAYANNGPGKIQPSNIIHI